MSYKIGIDKYQLSLLSTSSKILQRRIISAAIVDNSILHSLAGYCQR